MSKGAVHIADSQVMGRLPVLVTSTILGITGIGQFVDGLGSNVLTQFGGDGLNALWGFAAVLCAVLAWIGRLWRGQPHNAAVVEIGGIVLLAELVGSYAVAIVSERGTLEGLLIPLGICTATVVNSLGRAVLLWRRRQWVQRVIA